jgi:hypothetical protein
VVVAPQAVYNIITGTYPCAEEEAIQLAALQFQAKFGKFNRETYVHACERRPALALRRSW